MVFSPFTKSKNKITDDLFVKITWSTGDSPEENQDLLELIEELDQDHGDDFLYPIKQSLPYLTFFQTELLFQALSQKYGYFQVEKVALAHHEGKEIVTDGEVFVSPLLLEGDYQTILWPLIQSILTSSEFENYSYQEKREYFENQVYPVYRRSLNISDAALPLFPAEGEQLEVARTSLKKDDSTKEKASSSEGQTSPRRFYLFSAILGLLAVAGLGISFLTASQLGKVKQELQTVRQEVKVLQSFKTIENQVDVFSRYFLPTYYSGDKEALRQFLSDGNAKYTVPESGLLRSVILESLLFDPNTEEYTVTYVLSVKKEDTANIRLSFSIKEMKNSKYGFVVTTEPKESEYVK